MTFVGPFWRKSPFQRFYKVCCPYRTCYNSIQSISDEARSADKWRIARKWLIASTNGFRVVEAFLMMTNVFPLLFVIGLMFSPLAAVMAFVITYEEYAHHYAGGRKPLRLAAQAAAITFVVFVSLAVLAGFVATRAF